MMDIPISQGITLIICCIKSKGLILNSYVRTLNREHVSEIGWRNYKEG